MYWISESVIVRDLLIVRDLMVEVFALYSAYLIYFNFNTLSSIYCLLKAPLGSPFITFCGMMSVIQKALSIFPILAWSKAI